jgi:predicted dehydrogenase/threonine dehydrogenase-like Zn-dependent dehydrogenase
MKQVLFKKGRPIVEDVPAPIADVGEVLVQVCYSCISTGTELSGLKGSKPQSVYREGLRRPEQVRKALQMIRSRGLAKTVARISKMQQQQTRQAETGRPVGYSASGLVLEVGGRIDDIRPGDHVACAGAGIANHAEFIAVPRNLLVKVPAGVSLDVASTVTLGAIAMQGVRRASPAMGEYVAVIGLGILGQMTAQMLKASGCQVIGIDLEPGRIERALSLGMDKGLNPGEGGTVDEVMRFADGFGVDSAIITAATESSTVINEAMQMCRKKGIVVIVGAVGLNLDRTDFYRKELDVRISTSYGPGRYDEQYELKGQDYPYAYVRWSENRNMEAYLWLVGAGKIAVEPLIDARYPIEEAAKAYEELKTAERKPMIVLLEYSAQSKPGRKVVAADRRTTKEKLNVALVGVGNFVKATHLPNLVKLSDLYDVHAIADKSGTNAKAVAGKCGAAYATTEIEAVLQDNAVDVVLVGTRHNLHARLAIQAARAGKAVFVEKPMALDAAELEELVKVLEETKVPYTVGFNRRFSPCARRTKEIVSGRTNPMIVNYRMNAGFIPLEHWVHTEEGGGRNIGEACHIYDLFTFLTESEVESICAASISPQTKQIGRNDNFIATIKCKDGSLCNLVYTALGHSAASKERMQVYVDGQIICMDDYRKLEVVESRSAGLSHKLPDKGHEAELVEFHRAIRERDGYPIPLWQLIQATVASFEVEHQI